jgi:hypothetical protein
MSYDPERDVRPVFLETVRGWIAASGEVFVFLRYLAAAGAKDYAFCRTFPEFEALVATVPVGTDVEVFRDRQLPLRGTVTETFVSSALDAIPDGMEFLVISLETRAGSRISSGSAAGDSQEHLRETLSDFSGTAVALGVYPPFWEPDGDTLISAAKGGVDGPR